MNNKVLLTIVSLTSPLMAFAAGSAAGQSALFGGLATVTVALLFAVYAIMRSGNASNQLSTAGASSHQASKQSFEATTGNDHIVRATQGEGFTGDDFSHGNDIMDDEHDLLLDHSYDGIQELNNKLPPWWVGLFWVTAIIAVIYFPYYHMFSGWSSASQYANEMKVANAEVDAFVKANGGAITENDVTLVKDEASMAAGQAIFAEKCVACHLADGGGSIGPNLTDKYWLHGGSIKSVFKTIKYGVPEKGMVSWESSLTPKQIQQTSSYILVKLQGTTPAKPKEPQGELYEPEG